MSAKIKGVNPPREYEACIAPQGCWMRLDRQGLTWFARPRLVIEPAEVDQLGFLVRPATPSHIEWDEQCGSPPPIREGHAEALALLTRK